jgi:hypothetical protein
MRPSTGDITNCAAENAVASNATVVSLACIDSA